MPTVYSEAEFSFQVECEVCGEDMETNMKDDKVLVKPHCPRCADMDRITSTHDAGRELQQRNDELVHWFNAMVPVGTLVQVRSVPSYTNEPSTYRTTGEAWIHPRKGPVVSLDNGVLCPLGNIEPVRK